MTMTKIIDENELQNAYLKAAEYYQNSPQKAKEDRERQKWLQEGLENGTLRLGTGTCPSGEFTL
ncbi:MAG: hypothetical protein AAF182_02445 [Pseudomonadota bacterium]